MLLSLSVNLKERERDEFGKKVEPFVFLRGRCQGRRTGSLSQFETLGEFYLVEILSGLHNKTLGKNEGRRMKGTREGRMSGIRTMGEEEERAEQRPHHPPPPPPPGRIRVTIL